MQQIENNLNYKFKNKQLLISALHHSSIKTFAIAFERLEFLGDRVLGIVIAEFIFKNFKDKEGPMAKMHSAFVCADTCAKIARKLGINQFIKTADKNLMNNKTVLADAMESILGAIFIDSNYEIVKSIILNLWNDVFETYNELDQDPKTRLQEICQAESGTTPIYKVISISGPDHKPEFLIELTALNKTITAKGSSKKDAETKASREFLKHII